VASAIKAFIGAQKMLKILTEQIRFGGFLFLVLFFGLLPKRQASKMKLKTERMRQSRRRTIQGSRRANGLGFRFGLCFVRTGPKLRLGPKTPSPRLPTPDSQLRFRLRVRLGFFFCFF